jgi:endogenous inhibitor of DNA gyrase (YacG/DUF329 family)
MAIVMAECPECGKPTPHQTPGTHTNEDGEKVQPMKCGECGHEWEMKLEDED